MSTPMNPLVIYLSNLGDKSAPCDPKLLTTALQYRIEKQLMKPADFYRNITVWKLAHQNGSVEYYPRENDSDEAGFEKAVELRKSQGMSAREARKDAAAYPTNSGLHSEVNVVADIYRRPDISAKLTTVAQVFTERQPCFNCRTYMRKMFPVVLHTPFYYYVHPKGSERTFQTKAYGGNVMLYLLSRYGA